MSQPGWYPDPAGQPGMYRYWDGRTWSETVTSNPQAAAPGAPWSSGQQVPGQSGYSYTYGQGTYGQTGYGQAPTPYAPTPGPMGSEAFRPTAEEPKPPRKTPVGAIVALVAVLAVITLVIVMVVRSLGGGGGPGPLVNPGPTSSATDEVCPKSNVQVTPRSHPNDGRVHGGMVSFPQQPAPWSGIGPDDRVPFGADVHEQTYGVEQNYDGAGSSWVASLLVGDLVAGDGFYGPQEGANIVARCVIGLFYGNNKVDRHDVKSESHPVDGKDGWLIQTHLTFDIKGLKCKGETATIVVIATGTSSASLYYSSIPDTTPQLMAVQDRALADLKVGE